MAKVNIISFGRVNHLIYLSKKTIIMQELKEAVRALWNRKVTGLDEAIGE